MNAALLIRMVMARLQRNKVKAITMGIGIAVSALCTVFIQTAGEGFRSAFDAFIDKAYPSDTVWLFAKSGANAEASKLRLSDVLAVSTSVPDVAAFDPIYQAGKREVRQGARNARVSVTGVSDKGATIRRRGATQGEFFSEQDVRDHSHVALIGITTAHELFGDASPLGAQLFIDNVSFTVKGVLEAAGVNPHGGDQDDAIYLPVSVVMDQMQHTDIVTAACFQVSNRSRVDAVADEMERIVRERHHIAAGQKDDFDVTTPHLVQQLAERSFRIFDVFVPLISATAFFISGIVILSIMTVIIRQRTPELGLKKALGARRIDVMTEVIVEVAVISLIAGMIGLILSVVASILAGPSLSTHFGVPALQAKPVALLIGLSGAVVTGILGALIPARKAAALDPVSALR